MSDVDDDDGEEYELEDFDDTWGVSEDHDEHEEHEEISLVEEGEGDLTADLPPPPPPAAEQQSHYIMQNKDLFQALCEVAGFNFQQRPESEQEKLMKTIELMTFQPGENVITDGEMTNSFYFVVATEATAAEEAIEIVYFNAQTKSEVFLTLLQRGKHFGEKYFINRVSMRRGGTCRVPKDSKIPVVVGKVTSEHFDTWSDFRDLLLDRSVPLFQRLPKQERQHILRNATFMQFKDKDVIMKQGELGEEFFIIQEGAVQLADDSGPHGTLKELVILRKGDFFGEMSLTTNRPRVASAFSIKNCICVRLSKDLFLSALSDSTELSQLFQTERDKRESIRLRRKSSGKRGDLASMSTNSLFSTSTRRSSLTQQHHSSRDLIHDTTSLTLSKVGGFNMVNQYRIDKILGKGTFGIVYLCTDTRTECQFAMKELKRPKKRWNTTENNMEIDVLKRMRHINIVQLHEVIDNKAPESRIYLVQELMEGGELMPESETCTPIDTQLARKYFRDMLLGVAYLHSEGILHRDIKPQNMLLTKDGTLKLSDFGTAVFIYDHRDKVAYNGSPHYMAPELALKVPGVDFTRSVSIDVFSLGATLYFLTMGSLPWLANDSLKLSRQITKMELNFPQDHVEPALKHLLTQMLAKDYQVRCSLDAVAEDAWVTSEGIEPLYDADDYFVNLEGEEYADFTRHFDDNGRPFVNILILSNSITTRKLLAEKCASLTSVLCATAPLDATSEGVEAVRAALHHAPEGNFDFLFLDLQPLTSVSPESPSVAQQVLALGFTGHLVGLLNFNDHPEDFHQPSGLMAVLKKPIEKVELRRLFEEFYRQQGFSASIGESVRDLTGQLRDQLHVTLPPPAPLDNADLSALSVDSYVDDLSPSPPKPPHSSYHHIQLNRSDSRDSYGSGGAGAGGSNSHAYNSSVLTEKLRKLRRDNNTRLHREKSLYRMASMNQMSLSGNNSNSSNSQTSPGPPAAPPLTPQSQLLKHRTAGVGVDGIASPSNSNSSSSGNNNTNNDSTSLLMRGISMHCVSYDDNDLDDEDLDELEEF